MVRGDTAGDFWRRGYGTTNVAGGCVTSTRLLREGEYGRHIEKFPAPVTTLAGGYTVNMCVEYLKDGVPTVTEALDYGLNSQQSGLLYFFDRNNAEVLIKVLDGCGINGHRWVFVAPVTDLAFNLTVVSPDAEIWRHDNRLGQTAAAMSNTKAFACGSQ